MVEKEEPAARPADLSARLSGALASAAQDRHPDDGSGANLFSGARFSSTAKNRAQNPAGGL